MTRFSDDVKNNDRIFYARRITRNLVVMMTIMLAQCRVRIRGPKRSLNLREDQGSGFRVHPIILIALSLKPIMGLPSSTIYRLAIQKSLSADGNVTSAFAGHPTSIQACLSRPTSFGSLIMLNKPSPVTALRILSITQHSIFSCVSLVQVPMCGKSMTFSFFTKPG